MAKDPEILSTLLDPVTLPLTTAAPDGVQNITKADLMSTYQGLLRSRAIFYPVAFNLVAELGRGRQGVVFLGLRQGARGCITRHAIKLFDPAIYPTPEAYWTDMGRIAAQTSRLQTQHSPNLVAREGYDETHGIGYSQMEAIDGTDLQQFLRYDNLQRVKNRCTREEWQHFTDVIFRVRDGRMCVQPGIALHVMRQILRAIEILHEAGFVHSDIKPANVMIDRRGYVKVIDYGRAVMVNEKPAFLLGSPLYMAPELHRREPAMIQSDLYSTGLLGLEMLMGEPFTQVQTTDMNLLLDLKMQLPAQLEHMLPEHVRRNKELVGMLRRFIDPDPQKRYVSAEEAESGRRGLALVHKQLTQMNQDTEYGRELETFMEKMLPHAFAGHMGLAEHPLLV